VRIEDGAVVAAQRRITVGEIARSWCVGRRICRPTSTRPGFEVTAG
jgi:hypothetical protein